MIFHRMISKSWWKPWLEAYLVVGGGGGGGLGGNMPISMAMMPPFGSFFGSRSGVLFGWVLDFLGMAGVVVQPVLSAFGREVTRKLASFATASLSLRRV